MISAINRIQNTKKCALVMLCKRFRTKKHISRKDLAPTQKLALIDAQRAQIKKILSTQPKARLEDIRKGEDPRFAGAEQKQRLDSAPMNDDRFWGSSYGDFGARKGNSSMPSTPPHDNANFLRRSLLGEHELPPDAAEDEDGDEIEAPTSGGGSGAEDAAEASAEESLAPGEWRKKNAAERRAAVTRLLSQRASGADWNELVGAQRAKKPKADHKAEPRVLLREDSASPELNVAPLAAMRAVAELHAQEPQLWSIRRLSSFFNLSLAQVKRYIHVAAVESATLQRFVHESEETKRLLAEGDTKAFLRFVRRRALPLEVRPRRIELKGAREKDFKTGLSDGEDLDAGEQFHGETDAGGADGTKRADGGEGESEAEAAQLSDSAAAGEEENEAMGGGAGISSAEAAAAPLEATAPRKKLRQTGIAGREAELVAAEKLSNHLSDDLYVFVAMRLGVPQQRLLPTRLFVLEAFCPRRGRFKGQQRRLFGAPDDDSLAGDMGPKTPQLLRRELPESGPGSGLAVKGAPRTNALRAPLLIVDATSASRAPAGEMQTPIYVRDTGGRLRFANFAEHTAAMKKESNRWGKKKFSPH